MKVLVSVAIFLPFILSNSMANHDALVREFMHQIDINQINTFNIAHALEGTLKEEKKKCPSCQINVTTRLNSFITMVNPQVNYSQLNKKLFYIFKKHFTKSDIKAFISSNAKLDYMQKWVQIAEDKGNEKFVKEYRDALLNFSSNDRFLNSAVVNYVTLEGGDKIIKRYEKRAEKGSRSSLNRLCYSYIYGQNTEADLDMAVKWCKKGDAQNISSSTVLLAEIYYNQNSKKYHSFTEAMKLYEKAAANDHPHAQFILGVNLFYGDHIGQNSETALKWLKKAESNGHQQASLFISKNF